MLDIEIKCLWDKGVGIDGKIVSCTYGAQFLKPKAHLDLISKNKSHHMLGT